MIRIYHLSSSPGSVEQMARWAYEMWFCGNSVSFDTVLKDYKKRCNRNSFPSSFIAKDGDIVCGMVSIKDHDLISRKDLSPWVSSLFVKPEYRCKGIAGALLRVCDREVIRLNYNKLYLFADYRNSEYLEKFYTLRGWKYYSDEIDSNGHSVKVLSKILSD